MSAQTTSKSFRDLHLQPRPLLVPNPWDIGSAKILESLGFQALATTSGGFAWASGKMDGAVTLEDKLSHCRDLCAAVSIPISADLGSGFGDRPEAVAATVQAAIETGLAGCSIEDAANPYARELYEKALSVERIQAAVETARSAPNDFVLTARCERFAIGGNDFDDCLDRLRAYEGAGADVLYAPGMVDLRQIGELCSELSRPLNVLIGFKQMQHTATELEQVGVKRISLGTDLARIAYGAAINAAKEFQLNGCVREHDVPVRSREIAGPMTPAG